jgi:hypothetical protein
MESFDNRFTSQVDFNKLETMRLKVDTEDKELIILGDFNIDLMSDKIPLKWTHLKNSF